MPCSAFAQGHPLLQREWGHEKQTLSNLFGNPKICLTLLFLFIQILSSLSHVVSQLFPLNASYQIHIFSQCVDWSHLTMGVVPENALNCRLFHLFWPYTSTLCWNSVNEDRLVKWGNILVFFQTNVKYCFSFYHSHIYWQPKNRHWMTTFRL